MRPPIDAVASCAGERASIARGRRSPNPGRISAVHRLNRAEYNNAIRDLFALDIDVKSLLPGDETADGSFDNFADVALDFDGASRALPVGGAAGHAARDRPAAGEPDDRDVRDSAARRPGRSAERGSAARIARRHRDSLQLSGRRRVPDQGPAAAAVSGLPQGHGLAAAARRPPRRQAAEAVHRRRRRARDGRPRPATPATASRALPAIPSGKSTCRSAATRGWRSACRSTAGPHVVGVSFVRELWEPEGLPQPLQRGRVLTNDQVYMDYASVGVGPDRRSVPASAGAAKDTPSRRADVRLSAEARRPKSAACATTDSVAHGAARVSPAGDEAPTSTTLLEFFDDGRRDGGSFDAGIQFALERMLVDPDFLLRVHRDPSSRRSGAAISRRRLPMSDVEIASRLSFFLWSSIPDERLLELAERGQLTQPAVLEQEVRRMLADPRATDALVDDFAAQWLNLRRVDEVVVASGALSELRRQPARGVQARKRSCSSAARCARIAASLDLLRADYTFVNERLARHYGIPGIYGSRFRRVTLPEPRISAAGCSPRARCWRRRRIRIARRRCCAASGCSNNIFGVAGAAAAARRRHQPAGNQARRGAADRSASGWRSIAQQSGRAAAATRSSIRSGSRWRTSTRSAGGGPIDESGKPVDASGTHGRAARTVDGLTGLRALLLNPPDQFPRTVTEKLLAYALGRRLEYYDQPAVRTDRPRRRGQRLPLVVAHSRHREEPGVPDARRARSTTN